MARFAFRLPLTSYTVSGRVMAVCRMQKWQIVWKARRLCIVWLDQWPIQQQVSRRSYHKFKSAHSTRSQVVPYFRVGTGTLEVRLEGCPSALEVYGRRGDQIKDSRWTESGLLLLRWCCRSSRAAEFGKHTKIYMIGSSSSSNSQRY